MATTVRRTVTIPVGTINATRANVVQRAVSTVRKVKDISDMLRGFLIIILLVSIAGLILSIFQLKNTPDTTDNTVQNLGISNIALWALVVAFLSVVNFSIFGVRSMFRRYV